LRDYPEEVVALVVAFHGGELLEQCLLSLIANRDPRLQILVFDNGGGPAEPAVARLVASEDIVWTSSSENLGFGGGANAAVRWWRREKGRCDARVFVLINQDCQMRGAWLEPLLDELSEPHCAVVGARLLDEQGGVDHEGAVVAPNGLTRHVVGSEALLPIDYVCGAVMAVRELQWIALGGFDEGYMPVYFEEVDLCLRATSTGLSVRCARGCEVVHVGASSSEGSESALYLRRYHRSRMRLVARHLIPTAGWLRWLGSELKWLSGLRAWRHATPALAAYPALLREWLVFRSQRANGPNGASAESARPGAR
jgi:GT2 family glycosyltransferase